MSNAKRQPSAKHLLRMRRVLIDWSILLFTATVCWGLYFSVKAYWSEAALDASLAVLAVVAYTLARGNRLRASALLLYAGLTVALCFIAVFEDIPNAAAPRVSHHYFVVMGIGALLMFRGESRWLSVSMPLLCFVLFLFFASTTWGIETPLRMADHLRVVGAWLHSTLSLLMALSLLHVMQSDLSADSALSAELGKALADHQFVLHLQPQVRADGAVAGAEALLRWDRPGLGLEPPGEFIPHLERSGQIVAVGHWVLGAACAQLVAWSGKPETAALTLSVNVSAQQFKQADFVTEVFSVIERSGANPARLKLELTESMLVNDMEDIVRKMGELKARGIGLSLDDFGTGYSSLNYLKRLPLDQLKIDSSFVRDVLTDPQDAAIARTVVDLARAMQLEVIAEGVETAAHRDFLQAIGCDNFQGYLFSRPLAAPQFEAYLAATSASTAVTAKTPSPGFPALQV